MIRSNSTHSKLLSHFILVLSSNSDKDSSEEKPVENPNIFSFEHHEIINMLFVFSLLLCGVISISKVRASSPIPEEELTVLESLYSPIPDEQSKDKTEEEKLKEAENKLIQSTENLNNLINDNTKDNLLYDSTFYEKIHNHITYAIEYDEIVKNRIEQNIELPNHKKVISDAAMVIYHIGLRDERFKELKISYESLMNK